VERNPIRICELLLGLPEVIVLGVEDEAGEPIRVYVQSGVDEPTCSVCGTRAWVKDRSACRICVH
jgi:transposase